VRKTSDEARVVTAEGLLRIASKLCGNDKQKYDYYYSLYLKLCNGEISIKRYIEELNKLAEELGIGRLFAD